MVCMCFYNGRHLNYFCFLEALDSQLIPTALLTHFLTCLPILNHGGSSLSQWFLVHPLAVTASKHQGVNARQTCNNRGKENKSSSRSISLLTAAFRICYSTQPLGTETKWPALLLLSGRVLFFLAFQLLMRLFGLSQALTKWSGMVLGVQKAVCLQSLLSHPNKQKLKRTLLRILKI